MLKFHLILRSLILAIIGCVFMCSFVKQKNAQVGIRMFNLLKKIYSLVNLILNSCLESCSHWFSSSIFKNSIERAGVVLQWRNCQARISNFTNISINTNSCYIIENQKSDIDCLSVMI